MKHARLLLALQLFLVLALAVVQVRPLFKLKYLDRWASIEATFISDARFLMEHWPVPGWQPLWYGGTRYDYIYPPALRYGTVIVAKTLGVIPAKGYHIYTALFYCLGIVGAWLLVWIPTRSRGAAWLTALATMLVSPSYLFLAHMRKDAWYLTPQRLRVLVFYGEGPHMSALAMIGPALAFAYLALKGRRPAMFALSALCCALVVSNNFYGATALATFFPILCWAIWVTHEDHRVWWRAAGIALLAYGLTACWLVPSYFHVTVVNLKLVSERGNTWSLLLAVAVAAAFVLFTYRRYRGRREMDYPLFVAGSLLFFSLNVLGNYYIKFRVSGEPERLAPELDFVMILAGVEVLRRLWNLKWQPRILRPALALFVLGCFAFSRGYVRQAWAIMPRVGDHTQRIEYRITDWIHSHIPNSRALASGTVRFWYNAWYDLAQIGGGSEQGLQNFQAMPMQWQLLQGDAPDTSIAWMQAMGVDVAIVHDKNSEEPYKDYAFPQKFEGKLPIIYDQGKGDKIYQVPRRWPGLARVVETARIRSLRTPDGADDFPNVRAYADAMEKGPDSPVTHAWEGSRGMRIHAKVNTGESVVVQVSYDPYWRAYSGAVRLPTREDPMGQILIETPPGEHDIRMVFETPLENIMGRILTAMSLVIVAALFWWSRRKVEVPA